MLKLIKAAQQRFIAGWLGWEEIKPCLCVWVLTLHPGAKSLGGILAVQCLALRTLVAQSKVGGFSQHQR